jgi:hypothetical protein
MCEPCVEIEACGGEEPREGVPGRARLAQLDARDDRLRRACSAGQLALGEPRSEAGVPEDGGDAVTSHAL